MVAWKHADKADGLGKPWREAKPLQRYITDDSGSKETVWLAMHGNEYQYMASTGTDRRCFNLEFNDKACVDSLLWGVPALGLPYGFQPVPEPYKPCWDAWWRQYVVVAVADRSSLLRPSYNPTVISEDEMPGTRNGVPFWNPVTHKYRFAKPSDGHAYEVQHNATHDFLAWNGNGTPTTDFKEWLRGWKRKSWNINASDPYGAITSFSFPYTAIGLTGNWLAVGDDPDLEPEDFPAISEFILNGSDPMYIIGTWTGSQYLGKRMEGQVPWCDSCPGDVNMDGFIGHEDLALLLENWGENCPCFNNLPGLKERPLVHVDNLLWMLKNWGPCEVNRPWPLPDFRPPNCCGGDDGDVSGR